MTNKPKFTKEEKDFIKFLEHHSNFYTSSRKIAENKYRKTILDSNKKEFEFKLYSLDEICNSYNLHEEEVSITPKTTDAIWFKKENETFIIYLIEFKGDKLDNNTAKFKLIELLDELKEYSKQIQYDEDKKRIERYIHTLTPIVEKYSDKMLNTLALKPLETITIALPLIYQKYAKNNEKLNIKEFLSKCEIIYKLIYIGNEENSSRRRINSKRISELHIDTYNKNFPNNNIKNEEKEEIIKTYKERLDTYYFRYYKAGILNNNDFYLERRSFANYIKNNFL